MSPIVMKPPLPPLGLPLGPDPPDPPDPLPPPAEPNPPPDPKPPLLSVFFPEASSIPNIVAKLEKERERCVRQGIRKIESCEYQLTIV